MSRLRQATTVGVGRVRRGKLMLDRMVRDGSIAAVQGSTNRANLFDGYCFVMVWWWRQWSW